MSARYLPSIIILPRPPVPPAPEALKAAYQLPLTAALTTLATLKLSRPAILEVYVVCPCNYTLDEPRSQLFQEVEHLIFRIYSLICIVCAQSAIELDGDGGVDARVALLGNDDLEESQDHHVPLSIPISAGGPIIDIRTLALTRRKWNYIFSVDRDQAQEILNTYIATAGLSSPPVHGEIRKVQGGIILSSSLTLQAELSNEQATIHTIVAVGGTFDHLHAGHKLLLTATALLLQPSARSADAQRRLIIGITGDNLLKNKKYAEYLQSWKQRQEVVVDFLTTILFFSQAQRKDVLETTSFDEPVVNGKAVHTRFKQAQITIECVEIQDPFGPTITDESVSALIVSGETRSGGAAVNMKRQEKGWKPLEVFEVDVLDALDDKPSVTETERFAAKISSTAIRKRKAENAHKPSP